ncbi:MAG: AAA family ATPase [candidate division Zixibacteria bacterium]|nr:AAA family ATPase [candidate division Zixibacteria bacterium]
MVGKTIVGVEISNFKMIKAIDIDLTGKSLAIFAGENDQGKTSILDGLTSIFLGKTAICDQPLREGCRKGFVRGTLSDGSVYERTFTAKGTTRLKISAPDNEKHGQRWVDKQISKLGLDPEAFIRARPKDRVKMLLDMTGRRTELEAIDRKRKVAYDKRTDVNRELKRLEAQLTTLPVPMDDLPGEEVSSAEIIAEMKAAQEVGERNRAIDAQQEATVQKCLEAEEALGRARAYMKECKAERLITEHAANNQEDVPDISEFETKLAGTEDLNRQIREKQQRTQVLQGIGSFKTTSSSHTDTIEAYDEEKREILASVELPVPGLDYDEDDVSINGKPFDQASGEQQIRASVGIGFALQPDDGIKTLLIHHGEAIHENRLALLQQLAEEHGGQLIMARVGTCPGAIVIEDGRVAGHVLVDPGNLQEETEEADIGEDAPEDPKEKEADSPAIQDWDDGELPF